MNILFQTHCPLKGLPPVLTSFRFGPGTEMECELPLRTRVIAVSDKELTSKEGQLHLCFAT